MWIHSFLRVRVSFTLKIGVSRTDPRFENSWAVNSAGKILFFEIKSGMLSNLEVKLEKNLKIMR